MISLSGINPENLDWPPLRKWNCRADVLRLDKVHPVVSGNKWFKLKYYLEVLRAGPGKTLITFGGAYSNHIIAAACAARDASIPAVGIIRGEAPATLSPTLLAASGYGMKLMFVSRESYQRKEADPVIREIISNYPDACIIPEGGAGEKGIKGAAEILSLVNPADYTDIFCAVGTGTTFAGILAASAQGSRVTGVPVLKGMESPARIYRDVTGEFPGLDLNNRDSVETFRHPGCEHDSLLQEGKGARARFLPDYHFGGYAKKSSVLLHFMNEFYRETGIPTDFVYTGKLFYAFSDRLKKGLVKPRSRVLLIHSGGLQGNRSLPPGTLLF